MTTAQSDLYKTSVRRVSALLGAIGVGVIAIVSTVFATHRLSGSAEVQGVIFLAMGVLCLALLPVFTYVSRRSMPVRVVVGRDRILGWKAGSGRSDADLAIRYSDIRVLADHRETHFPLSPVPTVVSRREVPGLWPIPRLIVDGIDSPEAFTLAPDRFDELCEAMKTWISANPGSGAERVRCTPASLRTRLGLPDSPPIA